MTDALELGVMVLVLTTSILALAAVVTVRVLKEAVGCLRTLVGIPEPQEPVRQPLADTPDGDTELVRPPPWESWAEQPLDGTG